MIPATTEFDWFPEVKTRKLPRHKSIRRPPPIRIIIEFNIVDEINSKLLKALKSPDGWRRNARQPWHNPARMPVRFRCTDPRKLPTPEQIEALHAQILLISG
jgi:hypothetical protein